jgi:hypothetical protein
LAEAEARGDRADITGEDAEIDGANLGRMIEGERKPPRALSVEIAAVRSQRE